MPDKSTRREVLAMGVVAAASVTPMAHAAPTPEPQASDLATIEGQLAKPIIDAAKPMMARAIAYNRSNTVQRLKIKLPEGSEPCFDYRPMAKERRTR